MTRIPVARALVSVSDKSRLVPFARRLAAAGVEIVSSGGTATALAECGVPVVAVAEVTGSPEILGGRVKTLHPRIHGGILADVGEADHRADLDREGIETFQLVVVNLYPFETTVARPGVPLAEAVEQIDIGGPALIRAAAKNHASVAVVTSPEDYDVVIAEVEHGGVTDDLRLRLAADAFARTAAYDAAIVAWLHRDEAMPPHLIVRLDRAGELRYGENPHQAAALYREHGREPWWLDARILQGKPMSYNNYADAEAAWRLVNDLPGPAAVVVKHTNPCGAAFGGTTRAAFAAAWEGDPLAAFGGVVAINGSLDRATAGDLAERFVEVVVAAEVTPEAAEVLAAKRNLRVLTARPPGDDPVDGRRVECGVLLQTRDLVSVTGDGRLSSGWVVAAGDPPVGDRLADLELAWVVAAHAKSNAVVIAKGGAAVGVGAGDQSRVGAAERAIAKAGVRASGAVAAGDAFFPFRDGIDALADAGVAAVVAPSGSRRDDEVVAAATEQGMTLVLADTRHFRH